MKLFTWNMVIYYIIQNAWKGIQGIFKRFDSKWRQRSEGECDFLMKIPLQIELSTKWFHWNSVSTQYCLIQCVLCHFWWFSTEEMLLWSYKILLQVCWVEYYMESEEHGYAYFSLRRILFLEFREYTRRSMKWFGNMMMMHGYAYFLQLECYFICGVQRLCKRKHEVVWNMMHLWNSLKYDAIMK